MIGSVDRFAIAASGRGSRPWRGERRTPGDAGISNSTRRRFRASAAALRVQPMETYDSLKPACKSPRSG
jgi:hypothetical protein